MENKKILNDVAVFKKQRPNWKDHNTKYFHTLALLNMKNNMIPRIKIGGIISVEPKEIKAGTKE